MDLNSMRKQAQEKAQGLLKQHGDKIEKGVGKAEKFAKSKTDKYDDKIDKVAGKIRDVIPDKPADGSDPAPPPPPPA